MEKYIKCRHENGYFIFDTIERYPEDVANDILDEFIKQGLEAISYNLNMMLNQEGNDPALDKTNTIKNILEYKMEELALSNPD
jgi:hypothetical protein